jgi:hypothetical protein
MKRPSFSPLFLEEPTGRDARRYATPAAFKQALEQRLKSSSESGTELARRRQLLVFDRFPRRS